ncbi:MAG: amino acid-binding protein [Bacteroidales bacterium]|nr:amino acid-binding protein [Bacteroidales bacterium]
MTIKQLSVFLENRTGRINEVAKILGAGGINMKAFSMAETADFGLLRLIVPDVDKAVQILRDASFAVMLTDVVCLNVPNIPGALSAILDKLAENEIFIEYMYAFSEGDSANVVIRPNDIDRCLTVLKDCSCTLLQTV